MIIRIEITGPLASGKTQTMKELKHFLHSKGFMFRGSHETVPTDLPKTEYAFFTK